MATITRSVPIRLDDPDLADTVREITRIKRSVSEVAWNLGAPLSAPRLQKEQYHATRAGSSLNSQLVISAYRAVVGAYSSARANDKRRWRDYKRRQARSSKELRAPRRALDAPFAFRKESGLFLVGERGRDAAFRADGTLSISTLTGRKRLHWRAGKWTKDTIESAQRINSINVVLRGKMVLGYVSVDLEVPDPVHGPVIGIDRGEVVPAAAVSPDGTARLWSDEEFKRRRAHTKNRRSELQSLLEDRKARNADTRSVRRALKRLGRTNSNRATSFARDMAAQVCQWAPVGATLVLEDLTGIGNSPKFSKDMRERLSLWPHRKVLTALQSRAERDGLTVALVNPAYTSQLCSACGSLGSRSGRNFRCDCGHKEHADINAAKNIRNRYVASRQAETRGEVSRPQARSSDAGKRTRKPPPSGGGH